MEQERIYITIGHDGRGDDYYNQILYAGPDAEEASEKEFLEDSDFRKIELQVWKGGIHILTMDTDRDRRFTNWTTEFDYERKLKTEALKLEKDLARVQSQLKIINAEGGDDS